jgi:hypothetical protein
MSSTRQGDGLHFSQTLHRLSAHWRFVPPALEFSADPQRARSSSEKFCEKSDYHCRVFNLDMLPHLD